MATTTTLSPEQQLKDINAVATHYGVSAATLLGVYGTESAYGSNLGPSSAGALGPFQFLPSTGRTYGLNSTTIEQFMPSLVAAARYLKALGANTNPSSPQTFQALNNYNGNNGGTSQTGYVNSVLSNGAHGAGLFRLAQPVIPTSSPANLPGDVNRIYDAGKSAGQAVASVGDAIGWLFSNWLRVLEFLGGAVLGVFGLVLLGRAGREAA